jgi:predicted nucleic acid-binding protein
VSSEIVDLELKKLTNTEKLRKIQTLCSAVTEKFRLSEQAAQRADAFQRQGIKVFDSLHLAAAESGGATVFLTTDDRLLRAAKQIEMDITVANPVTWLMEVLQHE